MINKGLYTSNSAEWATPQDFFDKLNAEFHFTLDPCSTDENAKCLKHFTKEQNGLAQDWTGETVFCNPPYGREIWKWCRKCYEHAMSGGVQRSCSFMPGRTPHGSTTGSMGRRSFGSSVDVCISMGANGPRRFRHWLQYTEKGR